MPNRIRRLLRYWPRFAVAATVVLIYAAWPGRWTYTVGPETTYVTGPLDADGHVDYPAALNDRLGEGIRPETNANVVLWQALGPHPEGSTLPDEYFRRLGVPPPPEEGEYFVGWNTYIDRHLKPSPAGVPGLPEDTAKHREFWLNHLISMMDRPWDAKLEVQAADWLRRNERPLAVVGEAHRRPQYFNPLVSRLAGPTEARLLGSLMPNVQMCRAIGTALRSRAMERAFRKDFDGAWADLMTCQRLGRLVARGGSMTELLVGNALVAVATNGQVRMLAGGSHPADRLRAWLADVRALPSMPPLAEKFDVGERFKTLDSLQSAILVPQAGPAGAITSGGGPSAQPSFVDRLFTRGINWDPAFRAVNRVFDDCAAASRLPDRAARDAAFTRISEGLDRAVRDHGDRSFVEELTEGRGKRGEHIGNILLALLVPTLKKMQDSADRTEQLHRNLQVALALAAYRADTGRYPARLEDLAPTYIAAVPGDLFSGKPLIYRSNEAGYVLYSVGPNATDDEGRGADDAPKGDDVAVWMPPKERSKK